VEPEMNPVPLMVIVCVAPAEIASGDTEDILGNGAVVIVRAEEDTPGTELLAVMITCDVLEELDGEVYDCPFNVPHTLDVHCKLSDTVDEEIPATATFSRMVWPGARVVVSAVRNTFPIG